MSIIKSYSVGNGDMFYIEHASDNFTIIDCCLNYDTEDAILDEISSIKRRKGITRFISTHPDDDHLRGLERLDNKINIRNFYCVKNNAAKDPVTDSFTRYCELRDSHKTFYIKKGCTRKWMNASDDDRGSAGINILWPDINNIEFQTALAYTEYLDESPNNISPIIQYSTGKIKVLWMGDLETDFMETIEAELDLPKVTLLFAPHHGRKSGRIPKSWLEEMSPEIIIVGEAPSEHLHYYDGYNTITQNSAGDILFECDGAKVLVFTENEYEAGFLTNEWWQYREGYNYAGTLELS